MQTKLIVVRHGNTFNSGDVILRVGSRTDLPLTETGIEQARQVAIRLKERGILPNRFFVAPLLRTMQTQEAIARELHQTVEAQRADFLTELDYGEDDGQPDTEVTVRIGKAEAPSLGFDLSKTSEEELYSLGKETLKKWDKTTLLPRRWEFLQKRVDTLPEEWRKFANDVVHFYSGENVVAVTSNGIARFSTAILSSDAQLPESLKLSTGAFVVYEWNQIEKKWTLKAWNV